MDQFSKRRDLTMLGSFVQALACGIPLVGLIFCWIYIFSKLAATVRLSSLKYLFTYLATLAITVPTYAIMGINLFIHASWIWAWVGMSVVSFIALRILALLELRILNRFNTQQV
ncbi:hypothetical protein OW296_004542 [Salmonella enterica]|nr:hypothetical protein [Salmonella enterica]